MPSKQERWFSAVVFFVSIGLVQAIFSVIYAGEGSDGCEHRPVTVIGRVIKADHFTCKSPELVQFTLKTEEDGKKNLKVCQLDQQFKIKHWNDEIYGLLVSGIKVSATGIVSGDKQIVRVKNIEFPEIDRLLPPPPEE